MHSKQSEGLTKFYNAYLAWLEAGAETDQFTRRDGLCINIIDYFDCEKPPELDEIHNQFREAGLCAILPFNKESNGDVSYYGEIYDASAHLNQKRIDWVKEHATHE